jgi:hypothetical protein
MSFAGAVLLILTGLAILSFGLFLFYAWLPLLYAFVGFDIGLLLGRSLTGDVGTTAIVLGLAGAIALGAASYFLEPYRRILLGVSGGVLVGLSLAAALDLDTMLGAVMARLLVLICGVLGGILVPRFFDAFVIGSSAFSGAVMSIIGAHHLFPNLGLFDIETGGPLPTALAVVLTLLGVIWQSKNIAKWAGVLPISDRGPLG